MAEFTLAERADDLIGRDQTVGQQLVVIESLFAGGSQLLGEIDMEAVLEQRGIRAAVAELRESADLEAGLLKQLASGSLGGIFTAVAYAAGEFGGQLLG